MPPNTNLNTIQTIKNYVQKHNGLQLPNRFDVTFYNLPANIWKGALEVQAQVVTLSPRSISTIQDNLIGYGGGRFVPRSQNILPGPGVMVTFPITNDNHIIKLFNNWFNAFYAGPRTSNNWLTPFVVQFYDNIVLNTRMVIRTLNPNGQPNNIMTFYEVFPVEVQPIEMAMIKPDTFLTMTVIFGFREYVQEFPNQNINNNN